MKSISNIFSRIKRITPSKLKEYLCWKTVCFIDAFNDKRITGYDLTKTIPRSISVFRKGGTDSQPSRYLILKKVFSHVSFSSADSFIDVGCGQGRVLAFLIKNHCPCSISGVELSEVPGNVAAEWTKKYSNIHVILGDAFSLNYNDYSIIFLSQPFLPVVFNSFIQLIEKQLTHRITLIYLFDHASGRYMEDRSGWKLLYRKEFFKIHGLQVVAAKRRFSIWEYTPID